MGTKYYYDKLEENSEDEDVKSCMDGMNNGDTEVTLSNGDNVNLPYHDFKDVESLPEATKKLIESQTEHIVKQVAEQVQKTKGNIPGEFSEISFSSC